MKYAIRMFLTMVAVKKKRYKQVDIVTAPISTPQ
jgi:hypothetical protein